MREQHAQVTTDSPPLRILRHLLQYSPLIPPATRNQLLSIPSSAGRAALVSALNNSSIHFPLSQFPLLLSGAITFPVPVFTVWGLIEDVRVLEKFRTGEYEVHNLSILDEAASRLIEVSGLRLRLFGLGGAVAAQRMCELSDLLSAAVAKTFCSRQWFVILSISMSTTNGPNRRRLCNYSRRTRHHVDDSTPDRRACRNCATSTFSVMFVA